MTDHVVHDDAHHDTAHAGPQLHLSRRGYWIGFLLSVVLTAVPFWLVMTGSLDTRTTAIVIIVAAVIQILVHTIAFLHVNTRSENGWTLMAYAFAAVMVLIVISGSLWIMYHLNQNMMPVSGAEMESHL